MNNLIMVDIWKAKKESVDTATLEACIDNMVYALYGLSDEEIAVVEGRG